MKIFEKSNGITHLKRLGTTGLSALKIGCLFFEKSFKKVMFLTVLFSSPKCVTATLSKEKLFFIFLGLYRSP